MVNTILNVGCTIEKQACMEEIHNTELIVNNATHAVIQAQQNVVVTNLIADQRVTNTVQQMQIQHTVQQATVHCAVVNQYANEAAAHAHNAEGISQELHAELMRTRDMMSQLQNKNVFLEQSLQDAEVVRETQVARAYFDGAEHARKGGAGSTHSGVGS